MTNPPPFAAVAVIGLVLLTDQKRIVDLGTISRASHDGQVLMLHFHGSHEKLVLEGDDAKYLWDALMRHATPIAQLAPPEPLPLPTEPITMWSHPDQIAPENPFGTTREPHPFTVEPNKRQEMEQLLDKAVHLHRSGLNDQAAIDAMQDPLAITQAATALDPGTGNTFSADVPSSPLGLTSSAPEPLLTVGAEGL